MRFQRRTFISTPIGLLYEYDALGYGLDDSALVRNTITADVPSRSASSNQNSDQPMAVYNLHFSPDSKLLAATDSAAILLWQVETGEQKATLQGDTNSVGGIAFSPDGRLLASYSFSDQDSGNPDRTIRLWEVASGQQKAALQGHSHQITSIAFSPDGTVLASADKTGVIYIGQVTD
jgi:WD40 repeat protein